MADLLLNARFLMRSATGVDRVAAELVKALDANGLPAGFQRWHGLRPAGHIAQSDSRPAIFTTGVSPSNRGLKGHAWEQIALARAHPDDWLLSLCNMGPVLRRKQIVMLHDAQVFRQPDSYSHAFRMWYHALQPRLARRAAMILTVSEHSKSELEHFGVVPVGKARVVPNGGDHILRVNPDHDILRRHNLSRGSYFLALGSLAAHKNIAMLTAAARARRDTRLPLVVAGGGNALVFSDAGIAPSQNIRVIGRVTDPELRALYENAMALVFPSVTEGFGLPPLEAMFCGCPVIASTGGAVPEVCAGAAISVDPFDQEAWSVAMSRIAEDPDHRAALISAGTERAATFTWQKAARTLIGHLSELSPS